MVINYLKRLLSLNKLKIKTTYIFFYKNVNTVIEITTSYINHGSLGIIIIYIIVTQQFTGKENCIIDSSS